MKEVEKCEDLVEEDDVGVVVPVEDRLRVVDDQDALPEVVVMHLDGVEFNVFANFLLSILAWSIKSRLSNNFAPQSTELKKLILRYFCESRGSNPGAIGREAQAPPLCYDAPY